MTKRSMVAACLALAACGAADRGAPEPADAGRLDGVWAVEFTLESPLLPGRMPPSRTVSGEVALLHDAALPGIGTLSGRPTHTGSFATRFSPFGFELPGGGRVPVLAARLATGDTVEIALQPDDGARVRMSGVLAGDSVAGGWWYEHDRAGAASGRFVMRPAPR